jgi:hypothetical protein
MANRSYVFAVTLSESARRKPSGISSATVLSDREASVSSSFPSWLTLVGPDCSRQGRFGHPLTPAG